MAKDLNNKIVKIKSAQRCTARNGSEYFKLFIQDSEGNNHNAMLWECHNAHEIGINNEINISCNYDPNYKNYTINCFKLIKQGRLGLTEKETEKLFTEVQSHCFVEDWGNYQLDDNSKKMLNDVYLFWSDHKEDIINSPAAISHHHNYIGGLLQHTSELLNFIFTNSTYLIEEVDKFATAIAGAMMHDAGKIFEYSVDLDSGVINYQEDFKNTLYLEQKEKLSPHILYGYNWALQKGHTELAHIIGSHHYIPEHGAMFSPATPEAQLVFMADYFSSRFGKISVDHLPELKQEKPDGQLALIGEDEIPF